MKYTRKSYPLKLTQTEIKFLKKLLQKEADYICENGDPQVETEIKASRQILSQINAIEKMR